MGGGCGQPPVLSCRMTPAMGEVGPPDRPTATSPQAIATPLPRPRTNNDLKKKERVFRDSRPSSRFARRCSLAATGEAQRLLIAQ